MRENRALYIPHCCTPRYQPLLYSEEDALSLRILVGFEDSLMNTRLVYGSRRPRTLSWTLCAVLGMLTFLHENPSQQLFVSPPTSFQPKLKWSECSTDCCVKSAGIVRGKDAVVQNLVCFDLNFVDGNSLQRYKFLTPFNNAFSFYLTMAQQFFRDIGARSSFSGEVVWRIEDDATINPSLQTSFSSMGVASVGHSVHLRRGLVSKYTTLVPNFHFIQNMGYFALSQYADTTKHLDFVHLRQSVFWAGSTTGLPCREKRPCTKQCRSLQRFQLVKLSQDVEWLNCSFTNAIQWCVGDEIELRNSNMLSSKVNEREWMQYRGIIDIDGNVDAWGLRWRLSTRSVVFKVESDYENIYGNFLTDGVHFIGIKADLTDLYSKTLLVKANDTETLTYLENITMNARQTITKFSYESEVERVAQKITEFFTRS